MHLFTKKNSIARLLPLAIGLIALSSLACAVEPNVIWEHKPDNRPQFYSLLVDTQGDLYARLLSNPIPPAAPVNGVLAFRNVNNAFQKIWLKQYVELEGSKKAAYFNLLLNGDTLVATSQDNGNLLFVERDKGTLLKTVDTGLSDHRLSERDVAAPQWSFSKPDEMLYFNGCFADSADPKLLRPTLVGVGFDDSEIKWKKPLAKYRRCGEWGASSYFRPFPSTIDSHGVLHMTQRGTDTSKVPQGYIYSAESNGDALASATFSLAPHQPVMGYDGTLYFLASTNRAQEGTDYTLYALDTDQQPLRSLHTFQINAPVTDPMLPEPIISGSAIYFVDSADKKSWAITKLILDPLETSPAWTFTLPEGDAITSTPAISAAGTLYMGTEKTLYAIDSKTGLEKWSTNKYGVTRQLSIGLNGTLYAIACGNSCIVAIEGDGTPLSNGPWPKFRGDLGNTGQVSSNTEEYPAKLPIEAKIFASHATVKGLQTLTLDGSESYSDAVGGLKYVWRQTKGPLLKTPIIGASHTRAMIEIPPVSRTAIFGFTLEVSDRDHRKASSAVEVIAHPAAELKPPKFDVFTTARKLADSEDYIVVGGKRVRLTAHLSPLNTLGDPMTYRWIEITKGYKAGLARDRLRDDEVRATIPRVNADTTFTFEFVATNSAGTNRKIVNIRATP